MRLGCLGVGPWGQTLLKAWLETPGVEVVGFSRQQSERLGELEERFPGLIGYPSAAELITDDALEAVSIATPPATHFALAQAALQAGKHVFVEKPMCLSLAEAETLARLADEQGRTLMVGHLLAHSGPVAAVAQQVAEGAVGDLWRIEMRRLKLGRVRREEDVLWSFAVHDLSLLSRLIPGQAPVAVSARGAAYVQPDVVDVAAVNIEYEGGLTAHILVSWIHPATVRDVAVVGSRGALLWDDMAAEGKVQRADKWIGPDLQSHDGDLTLVPCDERRPLQEELKHFVACVESGQRPLTDGWDGVRVVRLLEAASASLQAEGAIVKL
jgi:predicted dehydrogenase